MSQMEDDDIEEKEDRRRRIDERMTSWEWRSSFVLPDVASGHL